MLQTYFHHLGSDPILLFCSLAMVALFGIDLSGVIARRSRASKRRQVSFSSTIVSIGLFATFVGVLIGLYGFDATNISQSVPKLLEGLRFAFAGSVLGMGLSLVLSIAHKLFGDINEQVEPMNRIASKLDVLIETIRTPTEMAHQFDEMKIFLQQQLQQINSSLDQALHQLARGASEEVVKALQRIMTEFNHNLTTQFGDNFKELNAACFKLIEWQKNYKTHLDTAQKSFDQKISLLDQSCVAAKELNESNEKTQQVCKQIAQLIKTYDVQIKTLETHLISCKDLGAHAGEFLSNTEAALSRSAAHVQEFANVIEKSVGKQSESLAQLTEDIDRQLPKALGELEATLTSLTDQFAADYRSLFQYVTNR